MNFKNFYSVKKMIKPELCLGDMPTTRDVYKSLILIAFPSVVEMVLTSLIGSVDTMMVGNLGYDAIAAVGLTGQPRMLFVSIFMAINIGVTAIVARRKGEGKRESANATLKSMLIIITGISLILTAVAVLCAEPLVKFAGAIEGETLEKSTVYFRILISALPFNALTMVLTASLRGIGNTKVTMYVNTASNIVNVIFNFILIEGRFGFPRLEVAGAAIASVIGTFVGFLLSLFAVSRKNSYIYLFDKSSWKPKMEFIKPVLLVGGNSVLEQIALRIGFFSFAKIVASLGTADYATHQICMQVLNITFTLGDGIGVAATSLVGQNMGKKRPDISMLYGKAAQKIALTCTLVIMIFIVTLRVPIVQLFNKDEEIVSLASRIMFIVALFQPFQTTAVVISGCLRGAGDTRYVALTMLLCITLIRPILSFSAVYLLGAGLIGAWFAILIDIILRVVFVYTRFSSFKWANIIV